MKFIILLSTLLLLSACNNAEIIEDADVQTNINIEENVVSINEITKTLYVFSKSRKELEVYGS